MSEMEKLAAMLSQKKAEQEQSKIDVQQEYALWVDSLRKLMDQLTDWLSPLKAAGVATVTLTTSHKSERPSAELAGSYDAPVLLAAINGKQFRFEPKGRFMMGSQGAVVVQGIKSETLLARIVENGQEQWSIYSRTQPREAFSSVELSEENFAKLIQDNV
jgi:hypothetical protein